MDRSTESLKAAGPASLVLPATREALESLSTWLAVWSEQQGLPGDVAFRLELVLTEAVTNILDNTERIHTQVSLEVSCEVVNDELDVVLTDTGPAFDPTVHPDAPLPTTLEEATPGGLGIRLMRRYTKSMAYRRVGESNHLHLTLAAVSAPPPG